MTPVVPFDRTHPPVVTLSLRDFYSEAAIRTHVTLLRRIASEWPDGCEELLGNLDKAFTSELDAMKAGRPPLVRNPNEAAIEKLAGLRKRSPAAARCFEAMLTAAYDAVYPKGRA